jgi:hypothetical protein
MLQKQNTNINFVQGLDLKTDPYQVAPGKFLRLSNSIFTKGGLLQKRNGYGELTSLPSGTNASYLTTFNGNLTAISNTINAFSNSTEEWFQKGTIQPVSLNTLPLIRSNTNQSQVDIAIATNGLICTVFTDQETTSLNTKVYKYVIADSVTGQNIVEPTLIPTSGGGTVTGSPRVFLLGSHFVILFTDVISAVDHLQYFAISTSNPINTVGPTDVASSYIATAGLSYDAVVLGQNLYIAYNTTSGGQSVKVTFLSSSFTLATPHTFASQRATLMSICVDQTDPVNPIIYLAWYDGIAVDGFVAAVNASLQQVLAPTMIIMPPNVLNITCSAVNAVCSVFYEVANAYSYDSSIATNFIDGVTCSQSGTVGTTYTVVRSVGLASKVFTMDGVLYFFAAYSSTLQSTYFLINATTSVEAAPIVVAKLAYENGGGYLPVGLPNVPVNGSTASFPYLFKDLITSVSKETAVDPGTQVDAIYSQTGINYANITFGTQNFDTAEIASALQLSGGFLWMYDGYLPVEQNFFIFPENVEATWSTTGGAIAAQPDGSTNTEAYFYQAVYEWTDNQGNAHRSAPSVPVAVTTTGSGTTGSIVVNIPTLRLTYKILNPVKITLYRWSVENEVYYEVTSITYATANSLTINNLTVDSIAFTDTLSDATILGNAIIYTTGGVVEDVNAPASNILALFDTRVWLVDAEDPNLLWYSKQVIEATPVEMSDLLTVYVSPNTGTNSSTGPITAMAPMDDKLILFKRDAIYYINGTGPDNTGANNQYSQPIFITSTVGCVNQASIVLMPDGLMFQSDKGIWLLGRGLDTSYIGAPVENFNTSMVQSALAIPETNQVRFTLSSGQTLMYDYYYQQWATFDNVPALTSCIYQNLHTYINASGQVFQETQSSYLDGSNPVLMSFITSWYNLAGLQGYQRAYFFYLLGTYISPHKLSLSIAYDYNSSPTQNILITPTNNSPNYGLVSPYGQGSPYGGPGNIENWRVFLAKQRCQAFQIQFNEVYDPSFGVPANEGLTLSGINLVYSIKKGFRPQPASNSAG